MMLVKDGPGKMILSNNNNTFAGGVTLNDGILSVTSLNAGNEPCALGATYGTAPWFIFNGGTINAGGATIDIANPGTTVTWTDGAGAGPIIGTGQFTKAGPGTLILAGSNNYSGGTVVSEGTLQVGSGGASGSIQGAVTLGDANTGASDVAFLVNRSDNNTHANPIVVSAQGTGTATIGSSSTAGGPLPTIFSGTVTLNRPTTMQGTDPDRTSYTNLISGNVGVLTVNGGARTTWEANNTFVGDVDIQGAGTILQVGSSSGATTQQIPNASDVNIGTGARLHLVFDNEAINGLTGTGTVAFYPGGGLGATTLTVGAGDANAAFGGTIENGSGTAMNLVKTGAGTQALTGNSTYTGTTTVNGGTLLLDGTHTGGAAYTVASGATLGGTGSTTSPVTVQGGGTLAPDGSLGTGSLDLEPLSFLSVGLDALTVFDSLLVTGSVDVGDANLAVALGYTPDAGDYFVIVDNDGTVDAVTGTFLGLPEGGRIFPGEPYGFWITYQGGDGNDIAVWAVPEPTTLALLGLGGLAALIRRRRRK